MIRKKDDGFPAKGKETVLFVEINLFTQTQRFHDGAVTFDIGFHQVIEHAAAFTHQSQQGALRVVVVFVLFEMFGQVRDPIREQRDLALGRTGVGSGFAVVLKQFLFLFGVDVSAHVIIRSIN